MIDITAPIRAESEANMREHWAKKAARAKRHRSVAWALLREADKEPRLLGPVQVTLTRIAPRELDDDNLRGALKATRDGVADWLGVPDNDPRVRWDYAQDRGKPKVYAVRIEVRTGMPV